MIPAGVNSPASRPSYVRVAHTSHLERLHALDDSGRRALSGLVGAWFVTHDEITRDRLMTLVDEARAVTSS